MFEFKYKDEKRLLERLWCILSNENNSKIAFWNKNGTAFVIADHSRFNSELCPTFFKECTFAYFLYFLKVCGFSITASASYEAWHRHFLRYNFIMIREIRFTSELLQPEIFYKKSLSDEYVLESFIQTQPEQQNSSSKTVLQYPAASSEHVTEAQNLMQLPTQLSTVHHDSAQHIVSLPIINQNSTQIPSQTVQLHQNPEVLGIQSKNNQTSWVTVPMDNQASWVIEPMDNQTSSAGSLQSTLDLQDPTLDPGKVSSQLNTLQTLPFSVSFNQGQSTNDYQNPCASSKCLPSYSNLNKPQFSLNQIIPCETTRDPFSSSGNLQNSTVSPHASISQQGQNVSEFPVSQQIPYSTIQTESRPQYSEIPNPIIPFETGMESNPYSENLQNSTVSSHANIIEQGQNLAEFQVLQQLPYPTKNTESKSQSSRNVFFSN